MNKINLKIYAIILLGMLGMVMYQLAGPVDRPENLNGLSKLQVMQIENAGIETPRHASGSHLTAGICALLLVGYLFWFMIRKFQNDSRAELNARKNSFYMISLATGRSEYDLFHKSAEGWSVSADRIKKDYARYMSEQVMPHYANDFVRKNQTRIDESLIVKREVKPTSWSDWAIAMLVFPGSLLLLYVLMLLSDKQ
jgi:hypothetical protein